ncbi:uncharacterized protein LOC122541528 [Chiloscyllium plagiosum]|uniref:uncharacterized protein LOC122541528 n=1 Tax=Chiloscyllium plagiosum TaxID=36176 RepID=UPI001CB882EB|nr:uncharacterized protein LOC122541528 [Chiloscyllium plagiosum]
MTWHSIIRILDYPDKIARSLPGNCVTRTFDDPNNLLPAHVVRILAFPLYSVRFSLLSQVRSPPSAPHLFSPRIAQSSDLELNLSLQDIPSGLATLRQEGQKRFILRYFVPKVALCLGDAVDLSLFFCNSNAPENKPNSDWFEPSRGFPACDIATLDNDEMPGDRKRAVGSGCGKKGCLDWEVAEGSGLNPEVESINWAPTGEQ